MHEYPDLKNQILGTKINGDTKKILVNDDGKLQIETTSDDIAGQNSLNSIFGESYVAHKTSIFATQFYYGIDTREWVKTGVGTGSGTITGTTNYENLLTLKTGATNGGSYEFQTASTLRSLSGEEIYYIKHIIIPDIPTGDGLIRFGLGGEDNGIRLGYEDVDGEQPFSIAVCRSGVKTIIPQSEFNLDKLDGTGKSGIVLDASKPNIYYIRGGFMTTVIFSIIKHNGEIVPFHIFKYLNTDPTENSISTIDLPATFEVDNGTTDEDLTLKCGFINMGKIDGLASDGNGSRSFPLGITGSITAPYARKTVIAFRNTGSFQGNLSPSLRTHHIEAMLENVSIILEGHNKAILIELIMVDESKITSGTWANVDADNSVLKYSVNAVLDFTGEYNVALVDSISSAETKSKPFLEGIKMPLRSHQVAAFTITSTTSLGLDWIFSNYWSEEF